ncbi:MAG: lectin-like protein [Candidatus Contendobacter sp.]|nr:lectin-like protein [Candidatus Contendobacter sp.]MDS4060310.1 lectin-like protein [Candidatus Contendobacter sp.]
MSNLLYFKLYVQLILGFLLAFSLNLSQAASNLTPYRMSSWSDKVVISNTSGGTTDSSPLYTSDVLSISWAVVNNGDTKVVGQFFMDLYVDGVKIKSSSIDSLDPGWYFWWKGYAEVVLAEPGEHIIRLVADSTNLVSELNENDNVYDKKINVLARNSTTSSFVWNGNGHSYQRIEIPLNWPEAKNYCESQGGYLATITSREENEFIFSKLGGSYTLWIGGTDAGHEETWSWVNNEPWSYSNWDTGEPNNAYGNENYLEMYLTTGKWNDNNLDAKFWFLCETPPSGSRATNITISQSNPGRYRLLGTLVDANGQPACGLALASGRCVFSCGPGSLRCEGGVDSLPLGQFDLIDLPTEADGTLTLQTFVFGSPPGRQVVRSDGTDQLVGGATSAANSRALNPSVSAVGPGRYRLTGTLVDANGQPACGLALASGRCVFSCGPGSLRCEGGASNLPIGQFELTDLPTEADGTLTLQTFVFGSLPGRQSQAATGGGGCSYTIDPPNQAFEYLGGSGTVTVSTPDGCAWTAQSHDDWITLTAGASVTGSGAVTYSVAANSSSAKRTGTLTIAGKTHTVTQNPKGPDPID